MLPCCPVIVMVYVPGEVPVLLLTQPQASVLHTTSAASRTTALRHVRCHAARDQPSIRPNTACDPVHRVRTDKANLVSGSTA